MQPRRAQLTSVAVAAALDIDEPDILDLLTLVRVKIGNAHVDGRVIARAAASSVDPVRYDVVGTGFKLPDRLRGDLTVLALPTADERARVLKLPDDRPPPMRGAR